MTTERGLWVRPSLYPRQATAIFCAARIAVIEASTKSGKTMGCIAWLCEQALLHGRHYWWVAPTLAQARIAYERSRFLRDSRGVPLGDRRDSDLSLRLPNGAVINFKSAERPDGLYGEDVYAVVMDEATRIREEAWHAVRSTVTKTRGPVRIIGNVKGRRNWAYRLAREAEAGTPGMHYARITAHDAIEAGVLDAEEIERARRDLPAEVFQQLYMAKPADDEGNPFGLDHIRACIAPLSTANPVAWGWDLAKSLDYTVGIGLDATGAVCRFERFQDSWDHTERRIREAVGHVPALVDATGVGDPIVERLKADHARIEGCVMTSLRKQQLMEGLQAAIHGREVRFPAGHIVQELEVFEYEYRRTGVRYGAPAGLHDDCVVALALAIERFRTRGSGVRIRFLYRGRDPLMNW